MPDGACIDGPGSTSANNKTYVDNNSTETWTQKRARFARMCIWIGTTGSRDIKLGIYRSNATNNFQLYKSLKLNNPLLTTALGNNIYQSDRNWFVIDADVFYPGLYEPSTNAPTFDVDASGYSGYWWYSGALTEGGSYVDFGAMADSDARIHIGFLIVDCSVSGNSGGASIPVGETVAYYGNVNYQTWDVGLNKAYLNINAPWQIEGSGFSGFVTVGTYAYTATTTISGILYTYQCYIDSANSSQVGVTEYLTVQSVLDDVYATLTGNDSNSGGTLASSKLTLYGGIQVLNIGGNLHIGFGDFSAQTSFQISKSMTWVFDTSGGIGTTTFPATV